MPKVYNKHHRNAPAGSVYIGRPTKWGNEYSHMSNTAAKFKVASREEAILAYEAKVKSDPEFIAMIKAELKGKDLVCFCDPLPCHGHVLLKIANE